MNYFLSMLITQLFTPVGNQTGSKKVEQVTALENG